MSGERRVKPFCSLTFALGSWLFALRFSFLNHRLEAARVLGLEIGDQADMRYGIGTEPAAETVHQGRGVGDAGGLVRHDDFRLPAEGLIQSLQDQCSEAGRNVVAR